MPELTNALRKTVASLGTSARARSGERAFIAQGIRCVREIAMGFKCRHLFATESFARDNEALEEALGTPCTIVRTADLERMSTLTTPPPVLAVMEIPDGSPQIRPAGTLTIALDSVRDPGNIGTIIRMSDWFGIGGIICSDDCADIYNPKVVQATMGALARVPVACVSDLAATLRDSGAEVYGTFLDGEDIYGATLTDSGIIVMGNEANGISGRVAGAVTRRLYIPPYPAGRDTVESLNVAVAASIAVARFRHPN